MRVRIAGVKPVHQFRYIAREIIDIAAHMATQGAHGRLIAARRAAKAEVDPPGVKGVQGAGCSAITSGEWLGSITPPDPRCRVVVLAAR